MPRYGPPGMMSKLPQDSTTFYPEVRRLLKDRITRIIVLILLIITLLYNIPTQTCSTQLSPGTARWGVSPSNGNSSRIHDDVFSRAKPRSAVGKVHVLFGEPNPVFERALKLHETHAEERGHPMYVLRERILSGLWSKPAFILSVMLQELAKPEVERLGWLLWVDPDVVLMNRHIPLDIFLPPVQDFGDVNMLVSKDKYGLNEGSFLIRVNPWSVRLLSAVIAFHSLKPEVEFENSEQSAVEETMEGLIEDDTWKSSVVYVPQYWFNPYPNKNAGDPTSKNEYEYALGGLQIHFESNRDGMRLDRMNTWMNISEQDVAPYNAGPKESGLYDEVAAFWEGLQQEREG